MKGVGRLCEQAAWQMEIRHGKKVGMIRGAILEELEVMGYRTEAEGPPTNKMESQRMRRCADKKGL